MVNYTRRAVRGAATVFIFSILAGFLGYLVRILFARNLTVEEYGLFYAVLTLVGLITTFRGLGLGQALVKYIPEYLVKKKKDLVKSTIITVALLQFIIAVFITIILFLSADYLSLHYFHSSASSSIIKLLAIGFILVVFIDVLNYSFQGFQNMLYVALTNFSKMLVILIIAFFGFRLNLGLLAPTLAYMFYPVILFVIFYPVLTKKVFPQFCKIKTNFSKKLTKKLFKFGMPVVVGMAGMVILGYTDTIMLTYFSGLEQVGLYNVALPTARILTYFSAAIGTVFFPMFSELWARKDRKRLRYGIENVYRYLLIIILPFALIMFSFPKIIIRLLFGSVYENASLGSRKTKNKHKDCLCCCFV